jgi:hypothetical protein
MVSLNDNVIHLLKAGAKPVSPASPPITTTKKRESSAEREGLRGRRALLNLLPDDGTIQGLVTQARLAMSKGIFWDRGSIINLVL